MVRLIPILMLFASLATLLGGCAHQTSGRPAVQLPTPGAGTVLQFRELDGFSGAPVAGVEFTVRRADEAGFELSVEVSGQPLSGLRSGQIQRYASGWRVLEDAFYYRPLRYEQGLPLFDGPPDGGREWHRSDVIRPPASRAEAWTVLIRAAGMEEVTVPAGTFRAARYERFISFFNDDPFRWRTDRREVLWYAPELGFWVKRQVTGTYVRPPWTRTRRGGGEILREDWLIWELESVRP
ncbi:MAG: hypothetical protein RIS59_700 [Pseudomonadota bacterium]|jgi:hypothetical protein